MRSPLRRCRVRGCAFAPAGWRGALVLAHGAIGVLRVRCCSRRAPRRCGSCRRLAIRSHVSRLARGAWLVLAGVGDRVVPGSARDRLASGQSCARRSPRWLSLLGAGGSSAVCSADLDRHRIPQAVRQLLATRVAPRLAVGGRRWPLRLCIGVPLGIAVSARLEPVRAAVIPARRASSRRCPSLALLRPAYRAARGCSACPRIGTVPDADRAHALRAAAHRAQHVPRHRRGRSGDRRRGAGDGHEPRRAAAGESSFRSRCRSCSKACAPQLVLTIGIAAVMAVVGAADLGMLIFLGCGKWRDRPRSARRDADGRARRSLADQGMRALERAVVSPGIRREKAEQAMITLEHLTKRYGDRNAVDDLTLTVRRRRSRRAHRAVGLRQDHDAAHDQPPDRADKRPHPDRRHRRDDARPEELRRHIGYAIQSVGLFPHLTVAENIATVPRLLGWKSRSASTPRVAELLDLVGLDPTQYARQVPAAALRRRGAAHRRRASARSRSARAADGRAVRRRRPAQRATGCRPSSSRSSAS